MNDLVPDVHEVFKETGLPTVTYVTRDGGRFETQLAEGIDRRGPVCLITGPSTTGKTTLYRQVAKLKGLELLEVRGRAHLEATDLWKEALEAIKFEQVTEIVLRKGREAQGNAKVQAESGLGWKWLAKLAGELSGGISAKNETAVTKTRMLADPSPRYLLPVLQKLPYLLVVEDFHYLRPEVQRRIFEEWKLFTDHGVSGVVVGTSHHGLDLVKANRDLRSRTIQIELPRWDHKDLQAIAVQGFTRLGVSIADALSQLIAEESVGLPIITQAVCLEMFLKKTRQNNGRLRGGETFSRQDVLDALHEVAIATYGHYSPLYDVLRRGARESIRRHNTYELVLWAFELDPLKFSLTREQIGERLSGLQSLSNGALAVPPNSSVTAMLDALGPLQAKWEKPLLEWNELNKELNIVEPTFLFYLRWRTSRTSQPTVGELVHDLYRELEQIHRNELSAKK